MEILRQHLRRWAIACFMGSVALATPILSKASYALTSFTGTYTQNFDALASTGTPAWTNDTTLPGWFATRTASALTTYSASTGTSGTGSLYSFGSTSASDRALGSVASGGTGTIFYGVSLRNDTGSPLSSLTIAYIGEQWRANNASAAQQLTFAYQSSGSDLSVASLAGSGWTDVSGLTFTSLQFGSASALDGNLAANRTALSATLSGLTVVSGDYIWLRWSDIDDSGTDHGLAIDDLSVSSAAPVPAPGVSMLPIVLTGGLRLLRKNLPH